MASASSRQHMHLPAVVKLKPGLGTKSNKRPKKSNTKKNNITPNESSPNSPKFLAASSASLHGPEFLIPRRRGGQRRKLLPEAFHEGAAQRPEGAGHRSAVLGAKNQTADGFFFFRSKSSGGSPKMGNGGATWGGTSNMGGTPQWEMGYRGGKGQHEEGGCYQNGVCNSFWPPVKSR